MKSWQLIFTDSYNRWAARFLKRHPELQPSYRKLLLLLEANPFHPSCICTPCKASSKGFIPCRSTSPIGSRLNF